jgi:hypothetical protein
VKISRKEFLKAAALASASSLTVNSAPIRLEAQTADAHRDPSRPLGISSSTWQVELDTTSGLTASIVHAPTGIALATGTYSYSFGSPSFNERVERKDGEATVIMLAATAPGGISLHHRFRISAHDPWIEEQVTISNLGPATLALPEARGGFVLPLSVDGQTVSGPLRDFKLVAVPYRREPGGSRTQYADYSLFQVLTQCRRSRLRSEVPVAHWGKVTVPEVFGTGMIRTEFPSYASEGWLLTDGRRGFLITKYSQEGMEWALVDRVPLDGDRVGLRWGGFGIYEGDPERGAWIAPQQSHAFGTTRITAFEGGIDDGFYTFRREMEARGHGCPQGFNPPVHWNELYDNKLWWLPDWGMEKPEHRRKYYSLGDMKEEAAKAQAIGCEALYLDPGWDTSFASKIWDDSRLGPLADFTAMLRRQYGLSLSLHTPLSGWCDASSYPRDFDRLDQDGKRVQSSLCGASRQYVEETLSRLTKLARGGAGFFMFDGTMFNGPCWDPAHSHRVPSGRAEHVEATDRLARLVHRDHPSVLIEMHDQVLGGTHLRYVPSYYGHGPRLAPQQGVSAPGFDSVWGFELMWDPMTDLVGGHSIALYYFNLAYALPLYLHIDLRKDNAQCLMFWWNASTCRHLGIGGTHPDPSIHKAHQDAMRIYRRLETFFKAGIFYGIDEMTHAHVHPSEPAAVINCFNLEDHPAKRSVEFAPDRVGLGAGRSYKVTGGTVRASGNTMMIDVEIPSYGHTLLELRRA